MKTQISVSIKPQDFNWKDVWTGEVHRAHDNCAWNVIHTVCGSYINHNDIERTLEEVTCFWCRKERE